MNFFDLIKHIYQKNHYEVENLNNVSLISLNKWLSYDKDNLVSLKRILKYLFYIEPKHYYYLLYFNIHRKNKVPFLKKVNIEKNKKDLLLLKIQEFLGWSDRELSLNMKTLENTILKNKKYWKEQFGM